LSRFHRAGTEQAYQGGDYDAWIDQIMGSYGDLKPSMLQDFERGRRTEIDFINGQNVVSGNPFLGLFGEGLSSTKPLQRVVARRVDQKLLEDIATAYRQGRRL
jgi:hypothetical protein